MGILVRNVELLQTLINNKRPPRFKPWWPSFCGLKSFLNTSIKKKPVSVSEVVTYENPSPATVLESN